MVSFQPPITSYEADIICSEIVWNNKCILIDKNIVYSKSLKQKGLVKVNDLLSSQGGFAKTNELLSRVFTHAEAFSIMSYQHAIPIEWRKKLKQKHLSITHTPNQKDKLLINDDLTPFTKLTHKSVYLELTSKINSVPTAQKRFINDYPNANFDWKAIYEPPLKVTVDIRTRQFQYKLLHRTLDLNKALFKMNIADTNKCTFCND